MVPFFSFSGRIRRKDFWINSIVLLAVAVVVCLILFTVMGIGIFTAGSGNGNGAAGAGMAMGSMGLMVLLLIPFFVASLSLAVRRWHDLNKSGLWVLVALVPAIGQIFAFVMTAFIPGTVGPNNYGPDPKAMPQLGVPA